MPIHPAGEHLAARAAATPDKAAIVLASTGEVRTYADLDAASARLARVFRDRGLRTGDHLAVLVDNDAAFFEVVWAAMRTGLFVTPINWHLNAAEAGFIVRDCGATALVASARLDSVLAAMPADDLAAVTLRLATDGRLDGFEAIDALVAATTDSTVPDEHEGTWMFYSSGTTGTPKGILPPLGPADLGAPSFLTAMLGGLFGFDSDTVYLSPAPLYHAAPAGWTTYRRASRCPVLGPGGAHAPAAAVASIAAPASVRSRCRVLVMWCCPRRCRARPPPDESRCDSVERANPRRQPHARRGGRFGQSSSASSTTRSHRSRQSEHRYATVSPGRSPSSRGSDSRWHVPPQSTHTICSGRPMRPSFAPPPSRRRYSPHACRRSRTANSARWR